MRYFRLATGTAIGAFTGFMLACSSLEYKLSAHQSAGGFEQAAVAVCTVVGFLIASHLDRTWRPATRDEYRQILKESMRQYRRRS
jgi:hypothetical protein